MRISLKPRRTWGMIPLVLLLCLAAITGTVEASDGMRGDRCVVGKDDYIAEDFYFFCRILEVRGTVDGDLLGVASEITIEQTGTVTGDLWVAGGKLVIEGTVGDDVHFVGISLTVSGNARFTHDRIDVVSAALNTDISQGTTLPGDLLVYGYQASVYGTVGGDIDFGGEALTIQGTVNGRVDASVGDARRSTDIPGLPIYDVSFSNPGLRIKEGATIGGDLLYSSASRSSIPPGVIQGRMTFHQSLSQADITKAEPEVAAEILKRYIAASIRDTLTLLLVGAVVLRFMPDVIRQPAQHVRRRTIPAAGWGLIAFMLSFPVAIMLIVLSLGILLVLVIIKLNELSIMAGIGLLVINLALIGGFWFLMLFVGRAVISFVIGQLIFRYVLRSPEPGTLRKWLITLGLGAAIYAFVTNAPVPATGLTIELITALAGIGAIVIYARSLIYTSRILAPDVALAQPSGEARFDMRTPPPPPEDVELLPGMDNLPDGFDGFDNDW